MLSRGGGQTLSTFHSTWNSTFHGCIVYLLCLKLKLGLHCLKLRAKTLNIVMASRKRKALAALLALQIIDDSDVEIKEGKKRKWIGRTEARGSFQNISTELSIEDLAGFKEMVRMSYADFSFILNQIEVDIAPKQVLGGRKDISPKARLVLTLRFLVTGEMYRSLCFLFRISRAAISYTINDVCKAIAMHLGKMYLKVPSTTEEWLITSKQFEKKWQYPHCLGAIDGKHIMMQLSANCGSQYYNYRHSNSIVLLAIVGPDYECLYADVGANGRISDGGVWNKCHFSQMLDNRMLALPVPEPLPFGKSKVPYVFVADDAFALKEHLMKPYPYSGLTEDKRIYNYRHSRACRISENCFGIIASRWRVFRTAIVLPKILSRSWFWQHLHFKTF